MYTNDNEKALAELVYSQLQENIPELMDNIIGFNIDQDDKEGVSVGLVGFNISEKLYIMPIVFHLGSLRPLIVLIDVESNKMLPATKDIIVKLKEKTNHTNMQLVNKEKFRQIYSRPNLWEQTISPLIHKMASLDDDYVYKGYTYLRKSPDFFKQAFAKSLLKSGKLVQKKLYTEFPKLNKSLKSVSKEHSVMKKESVEKSKVVPIDLTVDDSYSPPNEHGIYMVLNSTGHWQKKVCLLGPNFTVDSRIVMIDYDTCYTNIVDSNMLICKKCMEDSLLYFLKEKSIPIDKCEKESTYIFFDPKLPSLTRGNFTEPLEISSKKPNINLVPTIKTHEGVTIMISGRGTGAYDVNNLEKEIIISSDARAIPVLNGLRNADVGSFKVLMQTLNGRGQTTLKIDREPNTDNYVLKKDKKPIKKASSLKKMIDVLVTDFGIDKKDAQDMCINKKAHIYKKAFYAAPVEYETYDVDNSQLLSQNYPMNYDNIEHESVNQDIQTAMDAAQHSTKVFDSALLGAIINNTNVLGVTKEGIPILQEAINFLGKQLLHIWIHGNKYLDHFDSEALYTLEQNTLNSFKSLGEMLLTLSQKSKMVEI